MPVTKPQKAEIASLVAFMRLTGMSQKKAAKAAGIGERTLREWEHSEWWVAVCDDARARWLKHVEHRAMSTLAGSLDSNDAQSARWALERLTKEFEPPMQRRLHSGNLTVGSQFDLESMDDVDLLAYRRLVASVKAKEQDSAATDPQRRITEGSGPSPSGDGQSEVG